jgi:hypothetical protein
MKTISLSEAREIAEAAAFENLKHFVSGRKGKLLRDDYVEGEHCWFFFRNADIQVPVDKRLKTDWAYAVSRAGQVRDIVDFSDDPQKLADYLDVMSKFFSGRGG